MSFIKVARRDEIGVGQAKRFDVDGVLVAIFNVDGSFYAIEDTCTHEEASLTEEGEIVDHTVECTRHGARFCLRTGKALSLPAVVPVERFDVKVEGDDILVDVD